ncbi:zinc ribbon domain-containing protein [Anaerobutyricum hallii]|uniref:zinc ribbon domain-containing protein n=1 Tax=Anaerobutyricum hallii TaxID=39488 RepID=UPI003A8457BC
MNIRQLKEELSLSDRIYYCECGNRMDRDVNAAVNIMNEGKKSLQNVHDSTIKSP